MISIIVPIYNEAESLPRLVEQVFAVLRAHDIEAQMAVGSQMTPMIARATQWGEGARMFDKPDTWMPRERWDMLVRGEDCPLCAECQSKEPVNTHGYTIADLRLSRLRLALNQFVPGYCVLICTRHVQEPYHLTVEERSLFFDDMMRAAQALERVFKPTKMNFQLLGNLVPHLHAHIVPRYYGDPAPGRPIDPDAQVVILTPEAYEDRVRLIQAAL